MTRQTYHINNHPGLIRSFVSTVLNFKFGGLDAYYRKLESTHKDRVLAIWGSDDVVGEMSLQDY